MTSRFRYRSGDTNDIFVPYDADHPIEEGDLVFLDPTLGYARTATDMTNQGDDALNQLAFAEYFAGVAMQKAGLQSNEKSFRLVTDPNPPCIRLATSGLFEFDCAAGMGDTMAEGDLVGIYATGSGISDSQKVMAAQTDGALTRSRAIGFLRKQPATYGQSSPDETRCFVEVDASLARGGVGTVSSVAGTYTNASGQ